MNRRESRVRCGACGNTFGIDSSGLWQCPHCLQLDYYGYAPDQTARTAPPREPFEEEEVPAEIQEEEMLREQDEDEAHGDYEGAPMT
jgi:predicted  nucleic acid-binding Zn-ribbon protein